MEKPDFTVPIHDGSKFKWTGNNGCTDASDLGPQYTGRVWKDAADVGFIVRSHKTGAEKLFTFAGACSASGEIDDIYGFRYDFADGIKITVFND